MADAGSPLEHELSLLDAELRRLEAEYNMFFAGRLPRPPWETRARVQAIVKRLDRGTISNYGDKFRFSTLQGRFATFTDLWDRGLRAREEGRAGPFPQPKQPPPARTERPDERVLHATTFNDPLQQLDKLRDLYDSLAEARRESGQEAIPFHRFANLIKTQVSTLKAKGSPEVAFRVAVTDGKVKFTARALRGVRSAD